MPDWEERPLPRPPSEASTMSIPRTVSEVSETGEDSSELASSLPSPPSSAPSVPAMSSQDPLPSPRRNTKNLVIDSATTVASVISTSRLSIPITASPIATRYSSPDSGPPALNIPFPDPRFSRSDYSLDSPTVYDFPRSATDESIASLRSPVYAKAYAAPKPTDITIIHQSNHGTRLPSAPTAEGALSPLMPDLSDQEGEVGQRPTLQQEPQDISTGSSQHSRNSRQSYDDDLLVDPDPDEDLDGDPDDEDDDALNVLDGYESESFYNPSRDSSDQPVARKAPPPHLQLDTSDIIDFDQGLEYNQSSHSNATDSHDNNNNNHPPQPVSPNTDKPLPRSPNSLRLGSFFGWGSPSPTTPDPTDKGFSPSGYSYANSFTDASSATTPGPSTFLEAPKARNGSASESSRDYADSYISSPAADSSSSAALIEEMEDELKAISAELAASIRREMDLEDLVDRLQADKENTTSTQQRRTSDYFSDSGYSSAKSADFESSREEIEKIQRKAEQEKAQIRLDLTSKLQDERIKRGQLDEEIKILSERAQVVALSQVDDVDTSGRIKELENACETLRRKLSEERMVKDNFEDLLSALKGELQDASNERDNLRDEVVPQLRARVEGLESQASDFEKMTYESTKMQQELQNLKVENSSLKHSTIKRLQDEPGSRLSRSNSITVTSPSARTQFPQPLSRTASVKNANAAAKTTESREFLSDRLKDVEMQRDALHRSLKALLDHQEFQTRENDKKIRALEMQRDRLLTESPKKAGFSKEVGSLRDEINNLRRRAEEAQEQKYQVEKGLIGLKMDLDKSEMEIDSLKALLQERDILVFELRSRSSDSHSQGPPVTTDSLTSAYKDLQDAYARSIDRMKQLENGTTLKDEKTRLAMEKLEQVLATAISARDMALEDASSYQAQLVSLQAGEMVYLESEKALADELHEAARKVEEMAVQIRQQLASNESLRQRLTDTVARGEANQKANTDRIASLQTRLRSLEDQLLAAQNASEDRVSRHEEDVTSLKENNSNRQLSRRSAGPKSPRAFPPKSPLSPLLAGSIKSPRLTMTKSGPAMTVSEESQVEKLQQQVAELEKALADAEAEMQDIVGKMSMAQIEVMQLQEEREVAINRARRLEKDLQTEKVKAHEERFKNLQT